MTLARTKSRDLRASGDLVTSAGRGASPYAEAASQSDVTVQGTPVRKHSKAEQAAQERKAAEELLWRAKQRDDLRDTIAAELRAIAPGFTAMTQQLQGIITRWMDAQGFWADDNVGEKLALMHSELSETLEADRKNDLAEHIPGFSGVEEELADTFIRGLDFTGHFSLRLGDAIISKMIYNLGREYMHGKSY